MFITFVRWRLSVELKGLLTYLLTYLYDRRNGCFLSTSKYCRWLSSCGFLR